MVGALKVLGEIRLSGCWKKPCSSSDNREEIIIDVTQKKAFTLIELLVVVAIIGILSCSRCCCL